MEVRRQRLGVAQDQARGLKRSAPSRPRLKRGQSGPVRLQRFLAEAGVGSRRTCEEWIRAGRVAVNGQVVRLMGSKVDPIKDQVRFDGQPVGLQRKIYLALHKPSGCLCTLRDPEGRPTVSDLVPEAWRGLYPVGRLDWDSEGLLFLTNDGQFALRLTHPRFGCKKIYQVVVAGPVDPRMLQTLVRGVFEGGQRLRAQRARVVASRGDHVVVEVELTEGKNREVRRMFATLGVPVRKLKRIQIGSVKLGTLRRGRWRTLTDQEIDSLLQTL